MNELAKNIIDLYERNARHWDAARRAFPICENVWLDHFCSRMPSGGAILDVGCGGGEPIARYLNEHGFDVTGLDSSATMISLCQHRFPKCQWLVGDMRSEAIGSYEGEPLYHASLSEAEYRSLLSLNGFTVTAHLVNDHTCAHRNVWLAHLTLE